MTAIQFYAVGENLRKIDVRAFLAMKALKYGVGRFYAEYVSKDKVRILADAPRGRLKAFRRALTEEYLETGIRVRYVTESKPYR